jgi:hypothetical protein
MKPLARALLSILLAVSSSILTAAPQTKTNTYAETRELLRIMERSHGNKAFIKLFEEADTRKSDLIQALDDPEEKVSLNAQSILLYFADPQGLAALEQWLQDRRAHSQKYWKSPVELVDGMKFLTGSDANLAALVLENLHPNAKGFWAKVIAYNKRTDTAIVEVVEGEVFTTGWHVTIRRENGRWRILSNYGVWES